MSRMKSLGAGGKVPLPIADSLFSELINLRKIAKEKAIVQMCRVLIWRGARVSSPAARGTQTHSKFFAIQSVAAGTAALQTDGISFPMRSKPRAILPVAGRRHC